MTIKYPAKQSIERYGESIVEAFAGKSMVVFLCGPTYKNKADPGSKLRKRLEDALVADNFEVVLGEDDGLLELQQTYSKYAHENEIDFIDDQAAAIVLVAASVGSFCELGLFSYLLPRQKKQDKPSRDFILIVEAQFEKHASYFNAGPARAVEDYGKVHFVDFDSFDVQIVVQRLARRRTHWISEKRGRPRQKKAAP